MMQRTVKTLVALVVCGVCSVAQAQTSAGSYVIDCPESAPNLSLTRDALRTQVKNSIDASQYTNISVGISLRRVSLDTQPQTVSVANVLGNLELGTGTPAGLGFTVSGATDFAIECEWTYKVRISTRGRSVTNNELIRAVTDSDVKVRRQVFTRWRRPTTNP